MSKSVSFSRRVLHTFKHPTRKVLVFPFIIVSALIILSGFQIHGSSMGVYPLINGETPDPNLVANAPRGVRSDEWLVNTQLVIAQANNDFKRINTNIGQGQDMSVVIDVPYKGWSAIFKPQNLVFFILPLSYAFALKWWLIAAILILSCYFLMLELFPGKTKRAVLVSMLVGLSPMLWWWYQTITVLPVAYCFLLILFSIKLLKAQSFKAKAIYTAALYYTLVCFLFLLYPPFQIPCLVASLALILGWLLEFSYLKKPLQHLWSLRYYIIILLVIVSGTVLLFYVTHTEAIHAYSNTVYPGARKVVGGGVTPLLSFSSFLSPNLQYDQKAATGYLQNQSEASNFIFIAPFLFLPSLYLIIREKRKHNKILWSLLLINLLLAAFLARMHLTAIWAEPLYRIFLLDKVPNTRLLLGVGFVGILQFIVILKVLDNLSLRKKEVWALSLTGGFCSMAIMTYVGLYTIDHYPLFIANPLKVIVFSAWIAIAVFLILQKRFALGLLLLIGFSILATYKIHPVYRGIDPLTTSKTIQTLKKYPDDGAWAVLDDRLFINFPLMAGKKSINSVQTYPQIGMWRKVDPSGKYDPVYNRFAHVIFVNDPTMNDRFKLKHADAFYVKFESCGDFAQNQIKYVMSPKEIGQRCLRLNESISLPTRKFFIYRVTPPQN